MTNVKKTDVRIQMDDSKNGLKVVKKGGKDSNASKMGKDNFYTRVYDDAVSKKNAIDNVILE